jgi:hypothetical protein
MGRPRIIESPEELESLADAFFRLCEATEKPTTITGLALALGLSSRQALMDYEKRPEFLDVVKKAKARVEAAYEGRLWAGQPAGAIFALKNMGWSDKQEIEHKGGLSVVLSSTDAEL